MTIDLYPTLHLLPRPALTPSALTVARTGTATRVNALGWVEGVAANALRHDFHPASGLYLGWLVEEGRTNLILQARDLSQSPWTRANMTASLSARGMDGAVSTASQLTAALAGAAAYQAITAATATYTLSLDLRRVTGSGAVSLTLDGGASWFDVTSLLSTQRYTRVGLTQTLANPTPGLRLSTSGDVVAADYWQVEAGAFSTSRIPTTTAPMTRGADLLTLSTANGAWFNPDEGTVYLEAAPVAATTALKTLISSAEAPDAVELSVGDYAAGLSTNLGAIGSGFGGTSLSGVAITAGQPLRAALAYGLNGGGSATHAGVTFQTWGTGSTWDTSTLALGHQARGGAQRFLNGHLRHVAIFARRLSNAQAVDMTTL